MKLFLNDILYALSFALDSVEQELLGVSPNHAKRVAYLCVKIGVKLDLDGEQQTDLAACAVLHDNALTEYIHSEGMTDAQVGQKRISLGEHCEMGERNVTCMPFYARTNRVILYHHEHADGNGPFHKTAEETPLYAQIIFLADQLDACFDLSTVDEEKFARIRAWVKTKCGSWFAPPIAQAFLDGVTFADLRVLDACSGNVMKDYLPQVAKDYTDEQIIGISEMFARITDYKSPFTSMHSVGIAQKARRMGEYYGWDEDTCIKLYLAGALHDIGKLVVTNDILEKPAKLTDQEFLQMQNHAWVTYEILSQIKQFDDITSWASLHHEKLNGKGYPFGKRADQLGKKERLLACIDIYQALTEPRPYKDGMTHEKSIGIMRSMVDGGFIDGAITEDINRCFGASE